MIALLTRRSWPLQVLFCLPGTALFDYLLWTAVFAPGTPSTGDGLGWYTFALAAPLPALLLAGLPPARRWVAARRRSGVRGAR